MTRTLTRTLTLLARLQKEKTQQRRRRLLEAQMKEEIARRALQQVQTEFESEQQFLAQNPDYASPAYTTRALSRIGGLQEQVRRQENHSEQVKAQVLASHAEQKSIENLCLKKQHEQRKTRAQQTQARAEELSQLARAAKDKDSQNPGKAPGKDPGKNPGKNHRPLRRPLLPSARTSNF